MRFWDTSGIVPLLLEQEATPVVTELAAKDNGMIVWWGSVAECASAAARLRREEVLTVREEDRVLELLRTVREAWTEVQPSDQVLAQATRLLRVHPLKAADALQLGAATVWAEARNGAEFVTFDERLALAARLEGFRVLPG